jgi:putative Mg2+ transporter-C (MgtC) family protein
MNIEVEIIIRFLLAILWGGIVGAEREYRSKSAGFRTMILISIGACFFTFMSTLIGVNGSSDRIASNILTGIGFIGAGVIFRGKNGVTGITTAATIWAVAAVGMGIGAGYYTASASASILIIFVLAVLPYFEIMIDKMNQIKTYTICYTNTTDEHKFEETLKGFHLKYVKTGYRKKDELITSIWTVRGKANKHELFVNAMIHDNTIHSFHYNS